MRPPGLVNFSHCRQMWVIFPIFQYSNNNFSAWWKYAYSRFSKSLTHPPWRSQNFFQQQPALQKVENERPTDITLISVQTQKQPGAILKFTSPTLAVQLARHDFPSPEINEHEVMEDVARKGSRTFMHATEKTYQMFGMPFKELATFTTTTYWDCKWGMKMQWDRGCWKMSTLALAIFHIPSDVSPTGVIQHMNAQSIAHLEDQVLTAEQVKCYLPTKHSCIDRGILKCYPTDYNSDTKLSKETKSLSFYSSVGKVFINALQHRKMNFLLPEVIVTLIQ